MDRRVYEGEGAKDLLFAARLRPNRSLTRRGRRRVLAVLGALQAFAGLAFALHGAWPAALFLALTWTLVAIAFARRARAARAYEDVELSALELHYVRVGPTGRRRDWRFNPLWVRLAVARHSEFGVERIDLFSRRTRVEIGAILGRAEKTRLAEDLAPALARARRGPRFDRVSEMKKDPEMKKDRLD
ncbi:DUF2244 domain-containing protein [Rhodoblastus sp.]|uniref:DUF2244 domain-containing protein n=1 Tax=Rhodoblastus sp. TaxID=1962975 RepID=UPI0035B474AB